MSRILAETAEAWRDLYEFEKAENARLRAALETIAKGSRANARYTAYRALGYPEPHER